MNREADQIKYWAHMLDESDHSSSLKMEYEFVAEKWHGSKLLDHKLIKSGYFNPDSAGFQNIMDMFEMLKEEVAEEYPSYTLVFQMYENIF